VDKTCTGHILASVDSDSGVVTCRFCLHHMGHTTDIGHVRLSESVRLEVAAMLQEGVSLSTIMDNMRDRVRGDNLQRDFLLSR
jgi:hypothetical protein